jgi:hypothetical protein
MLTRNVKFSDFLCISRNECHIINQEHWSIHPMIIVEVLFEYMLLAGDNRVTKRCRLSWLTNSALVYEPKCGGKGGVAGSQPMSTAVHSK